MDVGRRASGLGNGGVAYILGQGTFDVVGMGQRMMVGQVALEQGVPCRERFPFAPSGFRKAFPGEAEVGQGGDGLQPFQSGVVGVLQKRGEGRMQEPRLAEQGHQYGAFGIAQGGRLVRRHGGDAAEQVAVEEFVERRGLKTGEGVLEGQVFRRLAGKIAGHGFGGGVGVTVGERGCRHGNPQKRSEIGLRYVAQNGKKRQTGGSPECGARRSGVSEKGGKRADLSPAGGDGS